MITFRIIRDQARIIESVFLPFMVTVAATKVRDSKHDHAEYFGNKIFLSLLVDVHMNFKRKFLTSAATFTFKLSDAEGIAFYNYLMKQPIDSTEVYVMNMRQQLCNIIHKQLFETAQHFTKKIMDY